jgi:hypothetical protein
MFYWQMNAAISPCQTALMGVGGAIDAYTLGDK